MDENTLIAYAMNGEPLPHWNGFPARIVVPGWTGDLLDEARDLDQRDQQAVRQLLGQVGLSDSASASFR